MAAAAGARRAVIELAGTRPGEPDQVLDRFRGQRRVHVDEQRLHRDLRDRRKILDRIVRQLRIKSGIHDVAAVGHQQRMAVGRRARDDFGADEPARAGAVLDDELLSHAARELLCEQAPERVDAPTGAARHDDTHRLGGIGLCEDMGRTERAQEQPEDCSSAAREEALHVFPPFPFFDRSMSVTRRSRARKRRSPTRSSSTTALRSSEPCSVIPHPSSDMYLRSSSLHRAVFTATSRSWKEAILSSYAAASPSRFMIASTCWAAKIAALWVCEG